MAVSSKSFKSRLAWKDHFGQKLEDDFSIEVACLHRSFEKLRPKTPDITLLNAWENGETGFPFVDACMRYLRKTGWINFRMRAMLMSFASYHLWLDWRKSARFSQIFSLIMIQVFIGLRFKCSQEPRNKCYPNL